MNIICVPTDSSTAKRLVCRCMTQQLWHTIAYSCSKLFSANAGTYPRCEEKQSLPRGRCNNRRQEKMEGEHDHGDAAASDNAAREARWPSRDSPPEPPSAEQGHGVHRAR